MTVLQAAECGLWWVERVSEHCSRQTRTSTVLAQCGERKSTFSDWFTPTEWIIPSFCFHTAVDTTCTATIDQTFRRSCSACTLWLPSTGTWWIVVQSWLDIFSFVFATLSVCV